MAEAVFRNIAARYDFLNDALSLGWHRRWKRRVVGALLARGPAAPRVLDLSTGTGDVALEFVRQCPEAAVTGADPCPPMLERARWRSSAIEWVEGSAEALPFSAASFDLISCTFGVRNFADRSAAYGEWARCLRPRGWVGLLEIHPPPQGAWGGLLPLYWNHLMPRLGALFARGEAYQYLRDSSQAFPTVAEFHRELARHGWEVAETASLFGGGMVSFSLLRHA